MPTVALRPWNGEVLPMADMPADLYFAVERGGPGLLALYRGGAPAGVALLDTDAPFLTVYVLPAHRGKGVGTAAARLLEARLTGKAAVMAAYAACDPAAAAFAAAQGYSRRFSSACMTYAGAAFAPTALAVRAYEDADYAPAHALYAEAFHRMRVAVGDFPDSVPEPPSDEQRREWADTADGRLVLLEAGTVAGYAHIEGDELCSVAIAPDRQGRGLGRGFVQEVCRRIQQAGHRRIVLYCVAGNPARRVYDALGFQERSVDTYAVKPFSAPVA